MTFNEHELLYYQYEFLSVQPRDINRRKWIAVAELNSLMRLVIHKLAVSSTMTKHYEEGTSYYYYL